MDESQKIQLIRLLLTVKSMEMAVRVKDVAFAEHLLPALSEEIKATEKIFDVENIGVCA